MSRVTRCLLPWRPCPKTLIPYPVKLNRSGGPPYFTGLLLLILVRSRGAHREDISGRIADLYRSRPEGTDLEAEMTLEDSPNRLPPRQASLLEVVR